MNKFKFLTSTMLIVGGVLTASAALAQSAPQVTGVNGCIIKEGASVRVLTTTVLGGVDGGGATTTTGTGILGPDAVGSPGDGSIACNDPVSGSSNATQGNFVTAGEVNGAFSDLWNAVSGGGGLTSVVTDSTLKGDGTSGNPIGIADNITNNINNNTNNIANLDNRVTNFGNTVSNFFGGGSDINNGTAPTYVIQGGDYNDVGSAFAAIDNNLTVINNAINGGGIKYFRANSTLPDSVASGQDAIAVGGNAQASGTGAIAMGANSVASADNSTALGAGATATHANSVALGAGSATDRANSLSVGSSSQTRQIAFVSAGTADTDAVNVSQLKGVTDALGGGSYVDNSTGKVIGPTYNINGNNYTNVGDALQAVNTGNRAYTDARIGDLRNYVDGQFAATNQGVRDAKRMAGAAGATGMAAAALRYDDRPGRGSVAGAVGVFRGYTALSTGVGYTNEKGNVRLNAAAAWVPTTNDIGAAVGGSWTFY